jgi:hypothetical protein
VIADTGAHVAVTRPDIAAGWTERQPIQRYTLQTASGEDLLALKEILLILTLGRRPLKILVFAANITKISSWGCTSYSHVLHLWT